MIVRAIDGSQDWLYGKGRNDYRQDLLAVAQNIDTRLSCFLNDCFFATDQGLDWFNLLGSKDQTGLNLAISTCILNTTNVTGLLQLTSNLDPVTRRFTVQYRVNTTYSQSILGTFTYDLGA